MGWKQGIFTPKFAGFCYNGVMRIYAYTATLHAMLFFWAAAAGAAPIFPGLAGNGTTDDTPAIQAALDRAGKTGGEVDLPPGQYLIAGSLSIPTGVTLQGSWNAPHHAALDKGTTLRITGGRGREDGPAAIEMHQSCAVRGFTLLWPDQKWGNIVPYPWAIHGEGMHNTVEDVTFVNAWQGIEIGHPWSELHLIRNVNGCVLRRGIFVDTTSDIGRIENVHFNCHYWPRSGDPSANGAKDLDIGQYMADHLEAFIFGRTDWEYVQNTFVFAAHIGYHFIQTPAGACNGQFSGIGADFCQTCVQIDHIQDVGLQITNGEFTSFSGGANTGVVTSVGANGAVQFVNCNFWANTTHAALLQGDTAVTFSACHFVDTPAGGVLAAERGRLIVQGCTFDKPGPAVVLRPGVFAAIVLGNLQPSGVQVENGIGPKAQIGLNEGPPTLPDAQALHYRLQIGAAGDEVYALSGWYGPEAAADAPKGFSTARWTMGDARLQLPVKPGAAYTLHLWLGGHVGAPPFHISVDGGPSVEVKPDGQDVHLNIPAALTTGQPVINVHLTGKTWSPHREKATDGDARELGVRVYGLEMTAAGAEGTSAAALN